MREAGMPFKNPNSGSWRIPGVYTLQEYLQAEGRLEPVTYQPKVGDIVLYRGGLLGVHTNIVVGRDGDHFITVGGNERNHIRVHKLRLSDKQIMGFGRLPENSIGRLPEN